MKTLLAALVFTLGASALAQGTGASRNPRAQQEQERTEGRRIGTGLDATEVGPSVPKAAELKAERKHAFTLDGTLKRSASGGLTLTRKGLPDATLHVRRETPVVLDGNRVQVGSLPPGAQVRATFQLKGDEPVAVEIHATSPKARSAPQPPQ